MCPPMIGRDLSRPHNCERIIVKRNLLLCCAVIVVSALIFAGCSPDVDGALITVMNPVVSNKMVDRIPLTTPRLDTLDGKTIYLVDVNWGGPDAGYSVFEEIRDWFAINNLSVRVEVRRKRGMYTADDPELWKEIAEKGHAALFGITG